MTKITLTFSLPVVNFLLLVDWSFAKQVGCYDDDHVVTVHMHASNY